MKNKKLWELENFFWLTFLDVTVLYLISKMYNKELGYDFKGFQ